MMVDLRKVAGGKLLVTYEESYWAERPEFRRLERRALQIVQCRYGHLYVHGEEVGWASDRRGVIQNRVLAVPGVWVLQDGDDGANVAVPVSSLPEVLRIVHPKRKRFLSPEQRAAAVERLRPYKFTKRGGRADEA